MTDRVMEERLGQLEGMIDTAGLAGVLDMLGQICLEKADHLRANWQDERAAQVWDQQARMLALRSDAARAAGI